jgi:hypothetical protein
MDDNNNESGPYHYVQNASNDAGFLEDFDLHVALQAARFPI